MLTRMAMLTLGLLFSLVTYCLLVITLHIVSFSQLLSFSVTKWIHLNHGDTGLQTFFRRLYDILVPGGRLVLEPQPWKSYKPRYYRSAPAMLANYNAIKMRPDKFEQYLVDTLGFQLFGKLDVPVPLQHRGKGFDRPVLVLVKPDDDIDEDEDEDTL